MKRPLKLVMIGALSVLLVVGMVMLVTGHRSLTTRPAAVTSTYYCPMHPSYTSDRPGDCPICNMRLIHREGPGEGAPRQAQASQQKDLCYLHNCPMAHNGTPCPMLVVAKAGERVICPICGTHVTEAPTTAPSRKLLYWTDPMIPGYTSDRPGKSPMGMDLVPVYAEDAGGGTGAAATSPTGYAPVLLTPQKQQRIGVRTEAIQRRHLTKTIRAAGTIAHDPELYQAQAEYIQARRTLEQATSHASPEAVAQAQRLIESTHIRLKHLGLSDEMIQEIAGWQQPEHSLLFAHPGEPVWVYAQVYEYELPLIRIGQEMIVETPSIPGERFRGTLRAIDQMVDPMTRTTRLRAQVTDPQGRLKPDLYVNAEIEVDLGEGLAVSREAVFSTGTQQIVFVDKGQGLFEPRQVVLGASADGDLEVTRGVAEGERVVTSGNFLIDSESRLKAALQSLSGTEEPQGHRHGP